MKHPGVGVGRAHLELTFPHELVCALPILLGDLHLVVTLFIAQYPQGLGAFQLYLELLWFPKRKKVIHEQAGPTKNVAGSTSCLNHGLITMVPLLPQKDPDLT